MKQVKVHKIVLLWLCVCLSFLAPACRPAEAEEQRDLIDYAQFREISATNFNSIKTGRLSFSKTKETFRTEESTRNPREASETRIQEIQENPNLSEDDKQSRIHTERAILSYLTAPYELEEENHVFTFDRDGNRYRDEHNRHQLQSKTVPDASGHVPNNMVVREKRVNLCRLFSNRMTSLFQDDSYYCSIDEYKYDPFVEFEEMLGIINPATLPPDAKVLEIKQGSLGKDNVVIFDFLPVADSRERLRIFADPTLGYRYRRIERFSGDVLSDETTAEEYREYDGIPLPMHYTSVSNGGASSLEVFLISAEINRQLAEETFVLSCPKGTIVTNSASRKKCTIRDTEAGKPFLSLFAQFPPANQAAPTGKVATPAPLVPTATPKPVVQPTKISKEKAPPIANQTPVAEQPRSMNTRNLLAVSAVVVVLAVSLVLFLRKRSG